ncbi:hypothetical protein ZHAS_00021961 [Anopheles sinensis]|uniref:Uncharacterized protein n=1 Tax=Anopheles sinensis TaxID=74873 RepID=A0A084WTB1_ANOSI|nr:hypothetical protein ZHAS_00021961 [Anopheles sinensis]
MRVFGRLVLPFHQKQRNLVSPEVAIRTMDCCCSCSAPYKGLMRTIPLGSYNDPWDECRGSQCVYRTDPTQHSSGTDLFGGKSVASKWGVPSPIAVRVWPLAPPARLLISTASSQLAGPVLTVGEGF